jgi:hypothetical protein
MTVSGRRLGSDPQQAGLLSRPPKRARGQNTIVVPRQSRQPDEICLMTAAKNAICNTRYAIRQHAWRCLERLFSSLAGVGRRAASLGRRYSSPTDER